MKGPSKSTRTYISRFCKNRIKLAAGLGVGIGIGIGIGAVNFGFISVPKR